MVVLVLLRTSHQVKALEMAQQVALYWTIMLKQVYLLEQNTTIYNQE
jgi:hypothetical protein